jgi:hypothetical protein
MHSQVHGAPHTELRVTSCLLDALLESPLDLLTNTFRRLRSVNANRQPFAPWVMVGVQRHDKLGICRVAFSRHRADDFMVGITACSSGPVWPYYTRVTAARFHCGLRGSKQTLHSRYRNCPCTSSPPLHATSSLSTTVAEYVQLLQHITFERSSVQSGRVLRGTRRTPSEALASRPHPMSPNGRLVSELFRELLGPPSLLKVEASMPWRRAEHSDLCCEIEDHMLRDEAID